MYLKEEIQNEALTRKVARFSEFLDLMALTNAQEISYQSLAGDRGVSPNSIKNYAQILEDTVAIPRRDLGTRGFPLGMNVQRRMVNGWYGARQPGATREMDRRMRTRGGNPGNQTFHHLFVELSSLGWNNGSREEKP